ncbi:S9 family peptidase [Pseudochryseolinea flava]|uniref:S9 family peptidase n=1 Tax=Pseudochryseolinea flava TaxID=2059302 RepID=A0A364Y620_9BACT|nr:S9 family peptidase [Pseudochryseolinea flava]RAW02282.1 S9 family peptidase [Pseudochryseolinea flava]
MKRQCFIISFFITLSLATLAQGTVEDFRRADAARATFRNKAYNIPGVFHWIKGKHLCWYLNNARTGKEFILLDADNNKQQQAFDHNKIANSLSVKLGKKMKGSALPFTDIEFSADLKNIFFQVDSAKLKCNRTNGQCDVVEIVKPAKSPEVYWGDAFDERGNKPVGSPDSVWLAFVRDNNVFIRNKKDVSKVHQLSFDGDGVNYYSSYITWSPDSKKLVAYKVTAGDRRLIHFVESSPADQLQPKLHTRQYLKPGDGLPQKQPQLFLIDEKKHVAIDDQHFKNQYFLENIVWNPDSKFFTFEFNERGHQRYRILKVSANNGEVKTVVDEASKTFIDYSGKKFRHDVLAASEIVWASERDGWNHLYLYDTHTGTVKNQITKGEWVVRSVIHVDETKRRILFTASGLDPDHDPYLEHTCVVNFDGSGFTRLTTSNADHTTTFSDDYKFFIDYESRIDLPPVCKLYEADPVSEKMILQTADLTDLQKTGWKSAEVFSAKGRDGETDIWGIVIRPSNFDALKKYPVVEMVYAGPQSFYVPKSWSSNSYLHSIAELGFIVVQVDGMGTSWRSKAFHDVCWKNLKDAGFPDRIAWIKALAQKYSFVDATRVGIFGGSAGGQNAAAAVLFHHDFYKAAVASCGSHDNRVDKIWWNEQWMGYPIGPHYAESSNAVHADKLGGKLMLIVGELDDNVDPASTLQVANGLIKANKDFELVVIPGLGHSGGGEFGERKRRDFFVKHLLNVDPPSWDEAYRKGEPEKVIK